MTILLALPAGAQPVGRPTVRPGIDGVLQAFQDHPLVGITDYHGLAQEEDFYAALIRDPRFAQSVGNVVVEFGNAFHQPIIDRYVNGEAVPYSELRTVWSDTMGFVPTVTSQGMINLYSAVREANSKLPQQQRIHVWLGDPPVDWSKVQTKAEMPQVAPLRDSNPANLIEREILSKNRKALVIYGGGHLNVPTSSWALRNAQPTLFALINSKHPGAFFRVTPYTGFFEKPCSSSFDRQTASWAAPAIVAPIRGTTLEALLSNDRCHFLDHASFKFPPILSQEDIAGLFKDMENELSGVDGDALLYLGPGASLTLSPLSPDIYLDTQFREEIARHNSIMGRPPIAATTQSNPAVPKFLHPQ